MYPRVHEVPVGVVSADEGRVGIQSCVCVCVRTCVCVRVCASVCFLVGTVAKLYVVAS